MVIITNDMIDKDKYSDIKDVSTMFHYQLKEMILEIRIKLAIMADRRKHWEENKRDVDFVLDEDFVKYENYLSELIDAELVKRNTVYGDPRYSYGEHGEHWD